MIRVFNEAAVITRETKKRTNLSRSSRRIPILNRTDLGGIYMSTLFVDDMPQKLNFLKPKFAFGEFGKKLLFL
ncbi:hypothetical protein HanPI659440_Chr08g0313171 [Helianthus annuus]|nr:hypothetical protein HanPI659440_Chr08g0313171 [Helianthus annuus]